VYSIAANYTSYITVITKDIFFINNFQSIIKGYQYNYMPNNLLYTLANINLYKWDGFIINRLFKKKIGLKNNKFVNFINNLKTFLCTEAKAIIPPLIYTKGLPRAL